MTNTPDSNSEEGFLGRGMALFPFSIQGGEVAMSGYEDQVEQSIRLILETEWGERVMRPEFGAGMESVAFEPLNAVTLALVRERVSEALLRFEPRIELLSVAVEADVAESGRRLLVSLTYRIRRTNSQKNLVYPFYVERGEA
ncbi:MULTISPECIES: GPW/gp25 family protein [unclassified Cyanobium]|uniref:GPW/gp25 family protein n=1 Tax=unclassified Cyanobium TaxID=2627006 RepID=UPI0020CE4995|nr:MULTISPECIES: GPW/gp25 family protein [unclassified Cyanobium]MCP9835701.1 GPW/gp25 family protein [Cyanobium sp. La Preciosa 7G6]MCP9938474.1 GPW/gp25 family protein [Cyanobium sp. Aljojuca 7A6]